MNNQSNIKSVRTAAELMHPLVSLLYFTAVLIITMFTVNPVVSVISLLGALLFALMLKCVSRGGVCLIAVLFLLITLTNPLFSHNGETQLFFINDNPVTLEALLYGVNLGVTAAAVVLWFFCINHIFSSEKIVYIFGGVFPRLSLVISLVLRFIPLFIKRLRVTANAMRTIGCKNDNVAFGKIRFAIRVFSSTVTWALENSVETSSSMQARGYGLKGRTRCANYHFRKSDVIMSGCIVILFVALIAIISNGSLKFSFYPAISSVSVKLDAVTAYLSFGALCFMPSVIEITENIKWKYLISKI